jgi:hypothetical protein
MKTPIDPGILTRTETLLKNSQNCSRFLNGVLAELHKLTGRGRPGTSFEELFNEVRGSIYSNPDLHWRGSGGPELIGDPNLIIEILIRPGVPSDERSAPTTIMHEIIHAAPGEGLSYSHIQMVLAAFQVAAEMGMTKDHDYPLRDQQPKSIDPTKTADEKRAADNWNSSLFDQILNHACR